MQGGQQVDQSWQSASKMVWNPVDEDLWTSLHLCGCYLVLSVLVTIISWLDNCSGCLLEVSWHLLYLQPHWFSHVAPCSPSHPLASPILCPGSGAFMTRSWLQPFQLPGPFPVFPSGLVLGLAACLEHCYKCRLPGPAPLL